MNSKLKIQIAENNCNKMMFWRKWAIIAGVPYCATLLVSLGDPVGNSLIWTLIPSILLLAPISFNMFKLVIEMHGCIYAILHVMLTIIMTPAMLLGAIFIPLLVRGDARRLLL